MWPRSCTPARTGKVALNRKNPNLLRNSRPRRQHRHLLRLNQRAPWQPRPHRHCLRTAVPLESLPRLTKRPLRRRTIRHRVPLPIHPKRLPLSNLLISRAKSFRPDAHVEVSETLNDSLGKRESHSGPHRQEGEPMRAIRERRRHPDDPLGERESRGGPHQQEGEAVRAIRARKRRPDDPLGKRGVLEPTRGTWLTVSSQNQQRHL